MKLPPDFRDLLAEFAREGVECAVIGGYAFAFHATPRATKDLDLLIGGSEDNRLRASRALQAFGASKNVVDGVRELEVGEIVYLGAPPLRVDILRTIDGVDTEAVLQRAIRTRWDGLEVRVISLDDLLLNKRAAARPRDLADVAELEKLIAE